MAQNIIDQNGLQIQTVQDILTELEFGTIDFPGWFAIYGADSNLNPNSPDGQMLNLFAQAKEDTLELIQQVYDSFDPDQAIGVSLDSRCAINGVVRNAGTYTQQLVSVVLSQALTLQGLDLYPLTPFTVADSLGNQYQLLTTYNAVGGGTFSLAFQAALLGPIQSAPNEITTVVTTQLGVISCTNPSAPTSVGVNEETDSALRIRRQNSVEQPSQGFDQGLLAGILAVDGVTAALVLQNRTSSTDANGIPPHSVWIIAAAPSLDNLAIAEAIYVHLNAGPGFKNGGTGGAGTPTITSTTIASIAVASGGAGYDNAPTVEITGDGTGALGHAVVSGGVITSFVVDAPGSGYTTAAVVLNPNTNFVAIPQTDGNVDDIYFDNPTPEILWISFDETEVPGTIAFDDDYVRTQLLELLSYGIGQEAVGSAITALVMQIVPNAIVSSMGVSLTNSGYADSVDPTAINYQFVPASVNIVINGTPGS